MKLVVGTCSGKVVATYATTYVETCYGKVAETIVATYVELVLKEML
jgi:hypothetical protein